MVDPAVRGGEGELDGGAGGEGSAGDGYGWKVEAGGEGGGEEGLQIGGKGGGDGRRKVAKEVAKAGGWSAIQGEYEKAGLDRKAGDAHEIGHEGGESGEGTAGC